MFKNLQPRYCLFHSIGYFYAFVLYTSNEIRIEMMEENSPDKKKAMYKYARYSSLAFQMMAAIGLGVWAGVKLDKHFQTKFVFTLILLLVALIGGFYWVYKDLTNKNN